MSVLRKLALTAAAGYAGIAVTRAIVRRRRDFDWQLKRLVITGGSRGLGLVLARQLADLRTLKTQAINSAIAELRGANQFINVPAAAPPSTHQSMTTAEPYTLADALNVATWMPAPTRPVVLARRHA